MEKYQKFESDFELPSNLQMVSGQTGDRGQDVDGVKSLRKGKEVAQSK